MVPLQSYGFSCFQSERFYAALKGHGVPCRLVILPLESHGFSARESIMHVLWEMDRWLEKHFQCNNYPTITNPETKPSADGSSALGMERKEVPHLELERVYTRNPISSL